MAKIPKSAKKEIPRKCPICKKTFKSKEFLVMHIERVHKEEIPEGWSASRYENYLRTNKDSGTCIVCKKPTTWNESTWKYNRLCGRKECSNALSKEANKNMINKFGKVHLLNDPEQQRKMIYAKKNSGTYYWTTDKKKEYKKMYASSVELKFLEMLDVFLNLDMKDVISPSPNNYVYKYNNGNHVYIPDVYIPSINLEIELKEPADNQNMHPKIQAVDKVKEKLKDELMESIESVNYIKINGSDYRKFFEYFNYLKNSDEIKETITTEAVCMESYDDILDDEIQSIMDELDQEPVTEKISTNIIQKNIDTCNLMLYQIKTDINTELNYNNQLNAYRIAIRHCDSVENGNNLMDSLLLFETNLNMVIKDRHGEKDYRPEMKFEAKRALAKVDRLKIELNRKIAYLSKKETDTPIDESFEFYVTEGYDKDAWYEDVEESFISGDKNNTVYKPVFVVLTYTKSNMAKMIKMVTDGIYSHASISLDTNLRNMCSFNGKGFVDEDILSKDFGNTGAEYCVYMYMSTKNEYDTIDGIIQQFKSNRDNLSYSIKGLINYLFKKQTTDDDRWFCSEFVSYLLNEANPKLLKRHYSLYSPDDLMKTRKLIKISNGFIKDYNPDIIDRKVRKELNKRGFENVKATNVSV